MTEKAELSLVFERAGEPRVFPIPEGTTTLGSARDNDLILADPSVKAHQVVLMRDGDEVELRDLFAGETRVNDEERLSGPLRPGDVLSLGEVRLRVMKVNGSPPLASPPPPQGVAAAPPASAAVSGSTGRYERPDEEELPQIHESAVDLPFPATVEEFQSQPDDGELQALRESEARRAHCLAEARQFSDELAHETEDDFEAILERVVLNLLETFDAERAVTVLFEEDGRNPLLTVERCRDGTNMGEGIAEEIVDRCLQVRTVLRIAGGGQGLGGLAAPLICGGKVLGLLYFERTAVHAAPFEPEDVHLTAILANQTALVIAPLVRD